MKGTEIKLGYAPTRRSIFSAPDAIKYRGLTKERLLELGVSFVDIDGINPEGLLYDDKDFGEIPEGAGGRPVRAPLQLRHRVCGGALGPGAGGAGAAVGPRDERPDENGVRLRDSQCGLFATGKVLRRFQVPFT